MRVSNVIMPRPSTGNVLHPPAGLARPPGMIRPGVPSVNAPGWWQHVSENAASVETSAAGAVENFVGGITSAVGGIVHGASHIAQGAVNTIDAVENGIQATGRLIPLIVIGAVGMYAINELGGDGSSKRQRVV